MRVSKDLALRSSEDIFTKKFRILSDAGAGVIHVRTHEPFRALHALRKLILVDGNIYNEWDIVHGVRQFTLDNMFSNVPNGSVLDLHDALAQPEQLLASSELPDNVTYFVFLNPDFWAENNPVMTHYLQQYSATLPMEDLRVVLVTPDFALPERLTDSVITLKFETPGQGELREAFKAVLDSAQDYAEVSDDEQSLICSTGAGMTRSNFEMYSSLAIVEGVDKEDGTKVGVDDIVAGLSRGKTDIVNKNDLLELYPVTDLKEVGGMENLKQWIAKRANCYSDEAADFGIEPPKGLVLVGIPGSGKSLSAKAIAKEFGVPLLRLDFGRVFNSLIGSSEERIRTALSMVEAMAPCVLFCDEVDKGLGGMGGSGDSGTSSRVLGSFLTWLNDTTAPVFTMVTANNVDGLPPELLRRGRFDATFATGFPTEKERMEVLNIHLNKRGWEADSFPTKERQRVVAASRGYVPAEIEAAVKDGLIDAFDEDEDFTMEYVVQALHRMVPMSTAYNKEIQRMVLWAKTNAVPASTSYDSLTDESAAHKPRSRTRIRKTMEKGNVTEH